MKKILISMLFIMIIVITGCGKTKGIDSEITSFSYNYGGFNDGYYNYNMTLSKEEVIYIATGSNGVNLSINKTINKAVLVDLAKLINDNNIYEWNGFNKEDNVSDGYSFELKVYYKNGEVIIANGYNKYPDNYDASHKALTNFLSSIK